MYSRSPEYTSTDLTPPLPELSALDETVRHYDATDEMITKLNTIEARLATISVQDSLDDLLVDSQHCEIVDTTPEKRRMEQTARNFVELTVGVRPAGDIYYQKDLTYDKNWGSHNVLYGITYIADMEYSSIGLKYMQEMSVLIHELAHETGDRDDFSIFYTPSNDPDVRNIYLSPGIGMCVTKISKDHEGCVINREGEFFEEAFAEETAARWRESVSQKIAKEGHTLWNGDRTAAVPLRFLSYDDTYANPAYGNMSSYAAHPAYAISQLSKASGIDLYALMIQMRQPDSTPDMKKQFIRAIDSVQPGLYKQLRELKYTKDEFIQGDMTVREILSSRNL